MSREQLAYGGSTRNYQVKPATAAVTNRGDRMKFLQQQISVNSGHNSMRDYLEA